MLAERTPALRVRCWGTRGSLPSPGSDTVRYGGNTSCVEMTGRGGEHLIFDAGSGIRPLGEALARVSRDLSADLFLTHFHWDHVQGLPFFAPIYSESSTIWIHGAVQGDLDLPTLVAGTMGPVYFPVPFEAVAAQVQFGEVTGAVVERGGLTITSHRLRHPTRTYGYRVDSGGGSVSYLPDNELVGGSYDVPAGWYRSLCRFLEGTDVLFHDAMFTDAEYPRYEGWGHSSMSQAIQLAEDAGVRRLCLFHHSPGRTDAELTRLVSDARDDLARRGSLLTLDVATEGEELVVEGTQ
jgi:phosphoribosyl 1,2-cyclic phosphodiesterase